MISPRTGEDASLAHAYTALTAAAHTNQQDGFVPYVVSFRSPADDEDVADAQVEEERLSRRAQRLQNRAAKNPNDLRLKRSFETASEQLANQRSVVETVTQNRSIELEEITKEITGCLLKHNYDNTVRIPHDSIMILKEIKGTGRVAFLVHPSKAEHLKEDACFKGRTLTSVMPPHVA